jgi:hypothetical protein
MTIVWGQRRGDVETVAAEAADADADGIIA